ncbi:MAG: peptidylprolyl isomerase, partial [Pseudomonadota bacterium]
MTTNSPCLALTAIALALALSWAPGRLATAQDTGSETQTGAETAEGNETTESTAEAEPTDPPSPFDVVVTVDGEELRLGELLVVMEALPAQYQQLPDEILTRGLIEQLVDQYLMARAAEESGVDESTRAAFTLLTRRRASLAESYMIAELDKRVTEDSVRAAYDDEVAEAEPVEEIRASHILVAEEEMAQDLRAQLDGGADFAELAAEHGTDGTAQRGGDLGYFTFEDMVPEFAEAAFEIEVGEIGGPV